MKEQNLVFQAVTEYSGTTIRYFEHNQQLIMHNESYSLKFNTVDKVRRNRFCEWYTRTLFDSNLLQIYDFKDELGKQL